jgi:hypothetical protein
MVSIKLVLLTVPDLSALPPKATKASTIINKLLTVLVFLSDFSSVIFLSFLFERGSIINQDIHVQNSDLLIGDFFIDFILSVI